jgi:hypothetical protein
MMIRASAGNLAICLAAGWLVCGCREGHQVRWDQPPPGTLVVAVDSASASRNALREPGMLGVVQAVPVQGWLGPDQRPFEVALRSAAPEAGHARPFGTITLPIALRSRAAGISQYPCSSCHQGRKVVMANKRIGDAHNNIKPVHPDSTSTVCSTCHSADDVSSLTLRGGQRAPMDESYRLCAQCHFEQAKAWAAGAHGKRLDGWQGRRVVMACPDCHDPHKPAVLRRIPFRAPELERVPRGVSHE